MPFFNYSLSRYKLSSIVIILDLIVCTVFIIYIVSVTKSIKSEAADYDNELLQITDFAVRVKNLPDHKNYNTLDQLRSILTSHFTRVLGEFNN